MTSVSRIILFLFLNAAWQVSLVALLAWITDRLLRGIASRFRHALWVWALAISVALTLGSTLRLQPESARVPVQLSSQTTQQLPMENMQAVPSVPLSPQKPQPTAMPVVDFNIPLALVVSGFYGLLLLYRGARLLEAWARTRALRTSARRIELSSSMAQALLRCRSILGGRQVTVLASSQVAVPVTTGAMRPVVILPERLLNEGEIPLLLSALGHEAAHIARRDYLLNLIYEFVSLPLWFHPATRLVLRRIRQTRELRCDEIVTERLLEPRIYAQSLVQLAGAALPFGRPAATITVGIADADILEERIMKILKNSPARLGRRSAFVLAALLFVAPCLALAPFVVRVSVHQPAMAVAAARNSGTNSAPQTPAADPRVATFDENATVGDISRVTPRRVKLTAASSESPSPSASQQESQKSEAEARERAERTAHREAEEAELKARQEREEVELQERAQRHAELARLARIPIDQAIQIAQRDTPGTAVEAKLTGERGGPPMYLVSILPPDGGKTTPLLVNAVDGTVVKIKPREEPAR